MEEGYIEKKEDLWYVKWVYYDMFSHEPEWIYNRIVNNDPLGYNEGEKIKFEFIVGENWNSIGNICKIIIDEPKDIDMFKQFEPKMNNRFIVEFPKEVEIENHFIKSITKPKYDKNEWQNIRIDFYDAINPSISQRLYNILYKIKIFDSFKINTLDPTGVVIEQWEIYVGKILTIDFGNFNYSDDGIQIPNMVIKPANCILNF